MAFTAVDKSDSSRLRRSWSLGPIKVQMLTYSCLSSDTSGVVTADGLAEVTGIITDGTIALTSAPVYSGNTATLAFVNTSQAQYTTTISSATATVGTTYSDANGNLFTVAATIASQTSILLNSTAGVAPTGTLTYVSKGANSGDASSLTVSGSGVGPTLSGHVMVFGV